jgi:hypothetical protein
MLYCAIILGGDDPLSLSRFALLLLVLGVLLPLGTAQAAPFVPGPEEYWIKVDKSRFASTSSRGRTPW